MPDIAIIGTNGAGKTVFITVLAHRLNQQPREDFVLEPEPKTFKYIETNWHLLNHREWPHHTTVGNSCDLRWKYKLSKRDGIRTGELRVIDTSGHDIRSIFADDSVTTMDALPVEQRSVAEYCRAADIAVFVADLNDYVEKPDSVEHIENETILKSAMDFLWKHRRTYCLVLAKADLYRDYILQEGGWHDFAAKHLSWAYPSHLASAVRCFLIACVNKTESIVDRENTRIVPTPGFDSNGLDPLVEWLVTSIVGVPPPPPPPPPPEPPFLEWLKGFFLRYGRRFRKWWPLDIAGALGILIFINNADFISALEVFFVVWGILAGISLLIRRGQRRGNDVEADLLVTIEEALHGAKKKISFSRDGRSQVETYEIRIPKGVREGQKLRLAGQGESAGPRGQAGDLYLVVRFDKHPDYNTEANKNG